MVGMEAPAFCYGVIWWIRLIGLLPIHPQNPPEDGPDLAFGGLWIAAEGEVGVASGGGVGGKEWGGGASREREQEAEDDGQKEGKRKKSDPSQILRECVHDEEYKQAVKKEDGHGVSSPCGKKGDLLIRKKQKK